MNELTNQQRDEITRAVREMNAARNSYQRAISELNYLIPKGVSVFHSVTESDHLFWSYEPWGASVANGVSKLSDPEARRRIQIIAPAPTEEFLPRLAS